MALRGQSVSLMSEHAFSLRWEWFTASERRFFLWVGSMHNTIFSRHTPQDKGVQLDQFLHSDIVWSKRSRRLLLRDLVLLCRWQEPPLDFLAYYLLIAVAREQHNPDRQRDRDEWFLSRMADTLQGLTGPPHEMLVESPRRPAPYNE